MLNASRLLKHLDVAILPRGCFWLLIAVGLVVIVPGADAAAPSLLDYFQACGIGPDAFAKFSDDRQIADQELDVIRRIAVRLRDCPTHRLERMVSQEMSGSGGHAAAESNRAAAERLSSPAEAEGQRGRMFEVRGSIASVEPVEDPDGEPLWRCTVTLTEDPHRAVVYVAELPEKLRSSGARQRVMLDGVFVKYVPGAVAEPMAVLVAPRLRWRGESPLGNLAMDFGLLEGIHDDTALTAADQKAFYRLLQLAKNANPARLIRDAEHLEGSPQGLPALFRDPASQRGRLVKLSGTALRAVCVPIDDPAVVARLGAGHYFEIDLVADGSQNNPVVFCTLDLPEGMPLSGPSLYGESIEVTGFFFKNWQYPTALSEEEKAANPGSFQALQTAPLVIGPAPLWKSAAVEQKSSTAVVAGCFLVLGMIGVCLLLWHFWQADQEFSRQVIARE